MTVRPSREISAQALRGRSPPRAGKVEAVADQQAKSAKRSVNREKVMEDRSMVRHRREDFKIGRSPDWRQHGKSRTMSPRWLWLRVAFTAARILLYLAQMLSGLAAILLQKRLLPLAVIRWLLRASYALTRLSFCVLRACMRRRASR